MPDYERIMAELRALRAEVEAIGSEVDALIDELEGGHPGANTGGGTSSHLGGADSSHPTTLDLSDPLRRVYDALDESAGMSLEELRRHEELSGLDALRVLVATLVRQGHVERHLEDDRITYRVAEPVAAGE